MGHPARKHKEDPNENWPAAAIELRFLVSVGGVHWNRMESSFADAEQLAPLRTEREEVRRAGREFRKHEQLPTSRR